MPPLGPPGCADPRTDAAIFLFQSDLVTGIMRLR